MDLASLVIQPHQRTVGNQLVPQADDLLHIKNAAGDTVAKIEADGTMTGFGGGPGGSVSDAAYNESTWNGEDEAAPSKNAVRDLIESILGKMHTLVAVSDEVTPLTTGAAKITFRAPYAGTLVAVQACLTTASSSGVVTFDVNKNGTTVLSTKLTVDASETTSASAAEAAVISVAAIAADDVLTVDIDTAGTGATGAKILLFIRPTV